METKGPSSLVDMETDPNEITRTRSEDSGEEFTRDVSHQNSTRRKLFEKDISLTSALSLCGISSPMDLSIPSPVVEETEMDSFAELPEPDNQDTTDELTNLDEMMNFRISDILPSEIGALDNSKDDHDVLNEDGHNGEPIATENLPREENTVKGGNSRAHVGGESNALQEYNFYSIDLNSFCWKFPK